MSEYLPVVNLRLIHLSIRLLFHPLVQWWRKGPIAHQIHRFMWSNAPIHYKISMMAYMFSYCESTSAPS